MRPTLAGDSLRRLCRVLLLPWLLLLAQQGAFLHGLNDHTPAPVQGDEHAHELGYPCTLCLAFASVDGATAVSTAAAALLPGLSFALVAGAPLIGRAATVPARRNRGPPISG